MRTWRVAAVASIFALAAFLPRAPQDQQGGGVTADIAVGKGITDRMPTDTASAFPADVGSLVCWTRVTGASGQKTTFVWSHGPHSDTVSTNIGGSPWRTYSRKTIPADWTGEWKVEVHDSTGSVVASKTFTVGS